MHDVATACLSPGFQTHDPSMKNQLARSMEMRDQQRQIIEARLHGKSTGGDKGPLDGPQTSAFTRAPGSSKRKGPPPGLSIAAPSAHQFASEPRVIQSAPLNQTFTGLKPPSGLSRQVLDRQPFHPHSGSDGQNNSQGPHMSNRLPPISDVFAGEGLSSRNSEMANRHNNGFHAPHSNYSPAQPSNAHPLPSPSYPPPPASAGLHRPSRTHLNPHSSHESSSARARREFNSAEDAIRSLSGGRDELLPKMVHYGKQQPPTPPSPHSQHQHGSASSQQDYASRSGSGRRRRRDEYERDDPESERMDIDPKERSRGAPSSGGRSFGYDEEHLQRDRENGRRLMPGGPFGQGRDSPETTRRKKEEFIMLCSRAWDLFHS